MCCIYINKCCIYMYINIIIFYSNYLFFAFSSFHHYCKCLNDNYCFEIKCV